MNQISRILFGGLVASSLVLSGCQTNQEQQGQIIGAIAGGILGNQVGGGSGRTAAVIAGTILGGYLGGNIGRQMDENDRYRANQALEQLPSGQTATWTNPDTGNQYAVTPTNTFYQDNSPCRQYTTSAWVDGKQEQVTSTACRQADGSWKVAGN